MNLSEFENMDPSSWVKFIKENVVPDDLCEEACYSLLHYFEDLGLLAKGESGDLVWSNLSNELGCEDKKKIIKDGVLKMSQTEAGFALSFFIGFEKIELPPLESLIKAEVEDNRKKNTNKPELASDLSNLQIVKKVGNQLKPFLEVEKKIVDNLQGKHTTKTDARNLFQYMFGKINSKAKPKKWEQLSRKRHR